MVCCTGYGQGVAGSSLVHDQAIPHAGHGQGAAGSVVGGISNTVGDGQLDRVYKMEYAVQGMDRV